MEANLGGDLATGSAPFAVSAWINPDVIDTTQNYVVSYGPGVAGEFFSMTLEDNGSGSSRIRYRAYAGFLDFDASPIAVGSGWHHVAAVLPAGSTTLGDFKFYLDGQPMARLGGPTSQSLNLQSSNFNIGNSSASNEAFAGLIDDVQYYNEPLKDYEIELLHAHPGAVAADLTTTTTFADFEFRTAAADGTSPASAGAQFAGPLFVRERRDGTPTSQMVRAFLKFDLSGLDSGEVLEATLYLSENHKLNSVYSADLLIGKVLNDWDATGGTAPVFSDAVDGEFVFGDNGPASAGPVLDPPILHEIDVTDFVKAWQADPSSNFGFRLALDVDFVGAAFDYTGDYAPVLVITQAVPEPSTFILGALGLLGLGFCGWRRRRS